MTSRATAVWLAGSALLLLGSLGCGGSDKRPSPQRPAAFRNCPEVRPGTLPAGLRLEGSELRNLGGNVMGRSLTFRGGSRELTIHVGYDATNALEDLDFKEETAVVGARRVTILTPGVYSEGRLLLASWREGPKPPCNLITVALSNSSRQSLLEIVQGIRVGAAPG